MIELLSDEIRKNGFVYKLVKRGNKAMIYEQYSSELNKIVAWEVFKRKIDEPKVIFGIPLGEREVFPGNEDFGKWAWSIGLKERAYIKFNELEYGE